MSLLEILSPVMGTCDGYRGMEFALPFTANTHSVTDKETFCLFVFS